MAHAPAEAPDSLVCAVIFDLDGVLVDSEIWWHEERVDWARQRGLLWTHEDSAHVMGANSSDWARIMRERMALPPNEEAAIEDDIVARVVRRYADGTPEIQGATDTVRAIAERWPVAIASSAHRAVIDAALHETGLAAMIPIIVSSDDVAHGKPAPDVYLETARQLGVAPETCLVVEDSLNGVRAARAAGMIVVLVPNESIPPAPGASELADLVLVRLADLDPASVARRPLARPS
ncbi:MAG: HAD family phosphatase [Chloroflexota bacterium]